MIRQTNNQSAVSKLRPVPSMNYLLIIEDGILPKEVYLVSAKTHEETFAKIIQGGMELGFAKIYENCGSFERVRLTKIPSRN